MPIIENTVRGAVKIDNLPDRACFTSWRDFLEALPKFLTVELPTSISGTVVGRDSPSEDDRDKIWFRRDASGNFLGIYAFQNGGWRPLYNIPPNQIIWTFGNSTNIPEGFVLIDDGDEVVPETVVRVLKGQYVPDGFGSYWYFAIRFVSF